MGCVILLLRPFASARKATEGLRGTLPPGRISPKPGPIGLLLERWAGRDDGEGDVNS
jgi:hypothetical protein